jgi:hypothetical protein
MSLQWLKCKVVGGTDGEPFRPSIARVNERWEKEHGTQKYAISYGIVYDSDMQFCLVRVEAEKEISFEAGDVEAELKQKEDWASLYKKHPHFRAKWQVQPDEQGADVAIEEWHQRITLNPDDTIPFVPKGKPVDPLYYYTCQNYLSTTATSTGEDYDSFTSCTSYLTGYWNSNVWVNYQTGATQIGTNVAYYAYGSSVNIAVGTIQYETWSCPQTSLNTTDVIVVNTMIAVKNSSFLKGQNFNTPALGATSLSASTWNFGYAIAYTYNSTSEYTYVYFTYGNSTYNSTINNLNYSTAVAPVVTVPALLVRRVRHMKRSSWFLTVDRDPRDYLTRRCRGRVDGVDVVDLKGELLFSQQHVPGAGGGAGPVRRIRR